MFQETHVTVVAVLLPTECSVVTDIILGMSWYRHFVTNPTTRYGKVSDFWEPENPAVIFGSVRPGILNTSV